MNTPNNIEVMIHYYGSRVVHPRIDAPAVRQAVAEFIEKGLLEPMDIADVYQPTEGGNLYVEMLCEVPYPVRRWIDPRD